MMMTLIVVAVVSGALLIGAAWGLYAPLGKRTEGFLVALAGGALLLSVTFVEDRKPLHAHHCEQIVSAPTQQHVSLLLWRPHRKLTAHGNVDGPAVPVRSVGTVENEGEDGFVKNDFFSQLRMWAPLPAARP